MLINASCTPVASRSYKNILKYTSFFEFIAGDENNLKKISKPQIKSLTYLNSVLKYSHSTIPYKLLVFLNDFFSLQVIL